MTNITNLQAGAEFDRIAKEQGWNLASIATILCDFIFLKELWPEAAKYAQERADEENSKPEGS